jgi:ATP-dependent Clp protease adaptor protein ClpS
MSDNIDQRDNVIDRDPISKKEIKIDKPRMWQVLFLNDDFTTVEFVIEMLKKYFHHTEEAAVTIAVEVHQTGKGIAGVYTYEVAETKVYEVMGEAKVREFPLKLVLEPIENNQ